MSDFVMSVLGWLGAIVGIATVGVVLIWAFGLVRVVTVQEATAVAFKYLGRFVYCAMEFTDHHFGPDGSICDGLGPNSTGSCWCIWRIGGWVFYIHPLVQPTQYSEQNDPDKFGEGIYVHLGDITPEPFASMAETSKESGSVPLSVKFVSTMRVINPYRWLFSSPKNVNEQVVKRMDAILRAWLRSGDDEHAQAARGDGMKLWSDIVGQGCEQVFDKIENDWGLKVLKDSIIVEDVGYDPEYQVALKAKSQAALQAEASVEETAGRIIRSVAEMSGMTVKVLKARLKANPKLRGMPASEGGFKEAFSYAEDQTKRDRAADAGDLSDIRVGNADGSSMVDQSVGMIIGGLAAAARRYGKGDRQSKRKKGPAGRAGDDSEDEDSEWSDQPTKEEPYRKAAAEFFTKHGVYPVWDPDHRTPVGDGRKPK
jgi:hypothetical protein